MDDLVYYDRFRLIELRSDIMQINSVMFKNLQAVENPHSLIIQILPLVLVAFLGVDRVDGADSWSLCRKYCTDDLRRAVANFDPSVSIYRESFVYIEKKVNEIDRIELVKHNIQPIVIHLYDWLCVCCAVSKRAFEVRNGLSASPVQNIDGLHDEENVLPEVNADKKDNATDDVVETLTPPDADVSGPDSVSNLTSGVEPREESKNDGEVQDHGATQSSGDGSDGHDRNTDLTSDRKVADSEVSATTTTTDTEPPSKPDDFDQVVDNSDKNTLAN